MLIPKELQIILHKFPKHKVKIIQLYINNLNFKSLCEDVWLSTTLLKQYKNDPESGLTLEDEYDSICSLLEKEVITYLQRN